MPVISMFIGDKTIQKMKSAFMQEIETLFPKVMKQYAVNLKDELDIESIVTAKVAAFSSDKLEDILYQIMSIWSLTTSGTTATGLSRNCITN